MQLYPYIKIALTEHTQQNVNTLLEYSDHPTGFMTEAPRTDTVFDYFLNARDCYVQWSTQAANYFALVFRNPSSTDHNSLFMITMAIDAGAALTGREVFRALNALRKTLVEEQRMMPQAVDDALRSCDIPSSPRDFDAWHVAPTFTRNPGAPACYRTYVSNSELESYLTFPVQEEYSRYSCVIYVAATTSLRPGVTLNHVLTPIRNVYSIITPEGVESSRPAAAGGDRIVLTYTRPGYSPIRETVVAGRPSAFVTYEGPLMVVRPGDECRLVFTRRIPLSVRSAKGGPVNGYTVTVNGRPVDTMQPYIEITDQDLKSGQPVVITVNSNNFISETLEIPAGQVSPSNPLSVMLNPIEQGITLRLDFGEGRVFEMQISLEKNTPEYSQLHGGMFHGFRARRLTVPGGGEIYYIDVRAGSRPSAPAFDNVAAGRRPEAPRFDSTLPTVDNPAAESESEESESTDADRRRSRRRRNRRNNVIGITIGLIVVAAMICAAVFYLFPTWFGEASEAEAVASASDTTRVEVRDTLVTAIPSSDLRGSDTASAAKPAAAAVPASASLTTEETDDVAYLNVNRTWMRSRLRSELGQKLYDNLTEGNIDAAVRSPYFTNGLATNTDAIKVADLIWASYGASTQKSNEKVLRALKSQESIDLHKLYDNLARYRSPEPNTAPRPKNN